MNQAIKIYVCGPTVYTNPHIGNMRPIIIWNIFANAQKFLGNDVTLIHNITDIDDKIIDHADKQQISETELTAKYIEIYKSHLKSLNIDTITHMPQVINNMDCIINFIKKLLDSNMAYISKDGIYYKVDKDSKYGSLSNRNIKDAQNKVSTKNKNNMADFALWKLTKKGMVFKSPWGNGRPGWHTECSALIGKYINNDSLDFHGGGIDLIFPHHDNEASQYRMLFKKEITKKWIHSGQLNIDGDKMSKSLNNIIECDKFFQKYSPDILTLFYATAKITGPLSINDNAIENIKKIANKYSQSTIIARLLGGDKYKSGQTAHDFALKIVNWEFSEAMKIYNQAIKQFNTNHSIDIAHDIDAMSKILSLSKSNFIILDEHIFVYNKYLDAKKSKNYDIADELWNKLKKWEIF